MVRTIDVCLACYQGEAFLPRLLDTLCAQDDPAFRVLFQDDGSTDATAGILAGRAALDLRFVPGQQSGQHLGAAGNFLSLLRQSDAAYTALCDQDDEWEPNRLSACRRAMEMAEAQYGQDTPILVHSDCCVIDEEGDAIAGSLFAHQGWDIHAVTLPRLLVQNNVTGCTLLMNAALRRLVAEAAPETLYMHDWFIALTAAAFGRIVFVDDTLVRYRQHDGNAIGASREPQLLRALHALCDLDKARARIRVTYWHAAAFRDAYAPLLARCPESAQTLDSFLAIPRLPRCQRLAALYRGGFLMQSSIARLGQLLLS